jgi:hypothetical protein
MSTIAAAPPPPAAAASRRRCVLLPEHCGPIVMYTGAEIPAAARGGGGAAAGVGGGGLAAAPPSLLSPPPPPSSRAIASRKSCEPLRARRTRSLDGRCCDASVLGHAGFGTPLALDQAGARGVADGGCIVKRRRPRSTLME